MVIVLEERMWGIGRGEDGTETETGRGGEASKVADNGFAESLRRQLENQIRVSVEFILLNLFAP
jgi:hypothetical protein